MWTKADRGGGHFFVTFLQTSFMDNPLMFQETGSSEESVRGLLWLLIFVAANIFFIYYVFEDQKLYRRPVIQSLFSA